MCDLQKALGEHQVRRNKYVVKEIKPYCTGCHEGSLIVGERGRTFRAICRSTTDLSENDLSFERTEDDKTELDWKASTIGASEAGVPSPTTDIQNASTMANQTVGGVQYIVHAYAKPDLLNYLERC